MSNSKKNAQVWGNRLTVSPDQLNIAFCAGRDVRSLPMADADLLGYDIWTNMAHARMLHKAGVLGDVEMDELAAALNELWRLQSEGQFQLAPEREDVHINVEHYLTEVKGCAAGKKIHSGRSRNDQVVTDMRLFLRDRVIRLAGRLNGLIRVILMQAEQERETILPGFTHYQPAMPTTVGHWFTGWSQALLRDLITFHQQFEFLNRCPLGAAAAFGTTWAIDRELTADLLGFDAVDANSLDCISSRGENEARIAFCITVMMNHCATIAQDLILLSSPFYGMVALDDRYVTGSSIMPQKRNPDFAELIRAKAAMAQGYLVSLLGIQKGSMSGYNRDSQPTKYLVMDLLRETEDVPDILTGVLQTLTIRREQMAAHCRTGFLNSADISDWLARTFGLPFRDAYHLVSSAVKYSDDEGQLTITALDRAIQEAGLSLTLGDEGMTAMQSMEGLVAAKQHTGAPSPTSVKAMIDQQRETSRLLERRFQTVADKIEAARKRCFNC
jgi:argininosuccinate lyase